MTITTATQVTREVAHALTLDALVGYPSVERWHAQVGHATTQAVVDLGLAERGRASEGEWTGCLYLTAAGERARDEARRYVGSYLPSRQGDADQCEPMGDEQFGRVAQAIAAKAAS